MERRGEEDRSSSPFSLSRCNCKKRSPVTNSGANSSSLFSEHRQPGRRRRGGGGGEGGRMTPTRRARNRLPSAENARGGRG